MKIRLDLDNTLFDSLEVWLNIYCSLFPRRRPIPRSCDLTTWELCDHYDMTQSEKYMLFDIFRSKAVKYVSLTDQSWPKYIRQLLKDGHEVQVLTSNPEWARENFEYALQKFGIELPIIFVNSLDEKFELEWDVLVDDAPFLVEHDFWLSSNRTCIRWETPYNMNIELLNNQFSAHNAEQVYKRIQFIEHHGQRI